MMMQALWTTEFTPSSLLSSTGRRLWMDQGKRFVHNGGLK
jgi:hypothetical protein